MIATCPSCRTKLRITQRTAPLESLARTSDPDTSHAAIPAAARRRRIAQKLTSAYAQVGPMTAEEACTTIGEPTAWRRVSELVQVGVLEPTPVRRPNRSRRLARVYRLTQVEAC